MKKFKHLFLASAIVASSLFTGATFTDASFNLKEEVRFQNYASENIDEIKNWGHFAHGFDKAHAAGFTGSGVKIAVIDSGFYNHPRYKNIQKNFNSDEDSFVAKYLDNVENPLTLQYHGSTVLSIVENAVPNVNVNFYAIEKSNLSYVSSVVDLINMAINDNVDVITISLSAIAHKDELQKWQESFNYYVAPTIARAKQKNIPIVIASGNEQSKGNTFKNYFTLSNDIVEVGAVDNNLSLTNFSSFNEVGDIDFVAAGQDLMTLSPVNDEVVKIKGTSLSAPTIASMLVVLKQIYPNATVDELKGHLKAISYDLGDTGLDAQYGNGFPSFINFDFETKQALTQEQEYEDNSKYRDDSN